jgi:hypothetical protein
MPFIHPSQVDHEPDFQNEIFKVLHTLTAWLFTDECLLGGKIPLSFRLHGLRGILSKLTDLSWSSEEALNAVCSAVSGANPLTSVPTGTVQHY